MRILIVDDEWLIVKTLSVVLTKAGYVVVGHAADQVRALKQVSEISMDLAIVDINLAGESAETVVAALLKREIAVLLISAYSTKQLPGWAERLPFLSKPIRPAVLLSTIAGITPQTRLDSVGSREAVLPG